MEANLQNLQNQLSALYIVFRNSANKDYYSLQQLGDPLDLADSEFGFIRHNMVSLASRTKIRTKIP